MSKSMMVVETQKGIQEETKINVHMSHTDFQNSPSTVDSDIKMMEEEDIRTDSYD
jgi:maltose-binding protein MalE